jgi:hypothetical protein
VLVCRSSTLVDALICSHTVCLRATIPLLSVSVHTLTYVMLLLLFQVRRHMHDGKLDRHGLKAVYVAPMKVRHSTVC